MAQARHCCIQSCVNFKGTTSENFYFFKPSMERHILDKWKEAIGQHQEAKNITFVCNLHFERESMIEMDGQLFLKHGSTPSIFRNNQPSESLSDISNGKNQSDEMTVKVEPISVETSSTVQLVNINEIITPRGARPIDNVCDGCHSRDVRIQNLLVNIEKFKKAYEQKRKLVCYWKSLAVYYKRGNRERTVVKIDKFRQQYRRFVPKKRAKPTELIKVEGRPTETMDVDEMNALMFEPDITEDETVGKVDNKLKKSADELLISLLKPYKCGKCDDTFEKPTELSRHMLAHKERIPSKLTINKMFECYICKREFQQLKGIRKHMKVHIEIFKIKRKCAVCQFEETADQHLCIQEEYISCEYCSNTFVSTKDLLKHLEGVHNEKNLHKCLKCIQSFRMMFLKIIHEQSHDIHKPFTCNECSMSFKIKDSLVRHQEKMHTNRKELKQQSHLCDQCGKEFNSKDGLTKHLLWHAGPTLKCPDCPQLFRTKHNLLRHSYLHRNDTFVCSICGVELSSPFGMKRHMRNVHGSKKAILHKCKVCRKKYKYKEDLRKHINVHKGIVYQCTFCDNSYKYKGDLNKHLRIHLGGKIYECKECDERFKLPMELQKHSFKHYKEK